LINDATQYTGDHDDGLAGYLQHVSLLTSQDEADAAIDGARITLMTVHSAKGLEFDHVIVPGLEEGIFPHSRSMEQPEEMEEERRLMYVAITRARQTARLSYAAFRMVAGVTQRQAPSRFIAEIPDGCVERSGGGYAGFSDPGRAGRFGDFDADDDAVYEHHGAAGGDPGNGDSLANVDGHVDANVDGHGDANVDGDANIDGDIDAQVDYDGVDVELCAGMRVIHPVFGVGEVRRISGEGHRMKVVVRFKNGREKTLIPEYSNLQVIPGGDTW
jgi:DNA helicase-2/ATP-dependent DNA helicase PcrA